MVATTLGKSGTARLWSADGTRPTICVIGSGSGAVAITNIKLIHQVGSSTFTTTDLAVQKEVVFTTDFSSVFMSGINLREFGLSITGSPQQTWNREGFAAVNFDGSNELQVQVTYQIF